MFNNNIFIYKTTFEKIIYIQAITCAFFGLSIEARMFIYFMKLEVELKNCKLKIGSYPLIP